MKKSLLFIFAVCYFLVANAQNPVNCYRLYLHDKADSPYSIDNPEEFLSPRALAKRTRFGIPITEEDLPVNSTYLQAIGQAGDSVLIMATSRWFNTVVVRCPIATELTAIRELAFIDSLLPIGYLEDISVQSESPEIMVTDEVYEPTTDSLQYGFGLPQIALHNGHLLHNEGFRGDSMLIAMLDAGWLAFDRLGFFSNLYENGQILGTYNFIPGRDDVFWGNSHGTACASIILSNINAENAGGHYSFVGTAPNANIIFIQTEHPDIEQPIEEDFWVAGAEIADSVGTDVITSSLGYFVFDAPDDNIDQSSLDGHTSLASRAATLAAHKGIVVCVAAGNEGANAWHNISRPADAEDILAVGAVNKDSIPASFTGAGPSFDGRVKPDIASCGDQAYRVGVSCFYVPDSVTHEDIPTIISFLSPGNGTSFATPCIAGLATCLWQALPQYNSLEIMQIIREASHLYHTPDTLMGYGIPDIYRAYLENREEVGIQGNQLLHDLSAYPNPFHDQFTLRNTSGEKKEVMIFDLSGRIVWTQTLMPETELSVNATQWANGLYLLIAKTGNGLSEALRLVRQ